MDTAEIRRRFIAHFESRGHTHVPSASLLRTWDPPLSAVEGRRVALNSPAEAIREVPIP